MAAEHWRIDRGLASDLLSAIGWSPEAGPAALTARIPQVMVCGSTAKLRAMAEGEVPPGPDAEAITRSVVGVALARSSGTVPASPAWSCWATATVTAALLEAAGCPVDVAAVRRTDRPIVDLHALLVTTDTAGDRWICDPFFGVTLPFPTAGPVKVDLPLGEAEAEAESDGRWTFAVRFATWAAPCRYRVFAPAIDHGDVRTICEISTKFSGVSFRRHARLHLDASIVELREGPDGGLSVLAVDLDGGSAPAAASHPDWAAAVADFAGRTGVGVL